MQKWTFATTTLAAVLALGIGAAQAEDQAMDKATSADTMRDAGSDSLNKAAKTFGVDNASGTSDLAALGDKLVGKNVTNNAGEDIGEIEDLAIGPDQDAYAIVAVGEFLGLGGRDVPINLNELGLSGEDVVLMSESSAEALKMRPEYNPESYRSYKDDTITEEPAYE